MTTDNAGGPSWSARYWEKRYATGGNSGKGSYGEFASFKAQVLNDFVASHGIVDVMELGSGDGNQLMLARYPRYDGYDVSRTAVDRCRQLFDGDPTKSFHLMSELNDQKADLTLSLDVIYHLIEDVVFERYMTQLFAAAKRYVIVFASNKNSPDQGRRNEHVRHRRFTDWVATNLPAWQLSAEIKNSTGSPADFYIYQRAESASD